MAMLLPASFGASRRMNDSHDIRKNLRFRNAELAQEHPEGNNNEWGIEQHTNQKHKHWQKTRSFHLHFHNIIKHKINSSHT